MMPKHKSTRTALSAIALAVLVCSGCTTTRVPLLSGQMEPLQPILTPSPDSTIGMANEDSVEIPAANMFISMPTVDSDPLPDLTVRRLSFSGSNPAEVVRTLLAGTNISVVVRNESQNSTVLRHSVTAANISGKLGDVLGRLSDSVGFFYSYRNGVLEVSSDMQFIAELPPVNAVFESLPLMLKALGATEIFLDKSARTMTYRATKPVHEKVTRYLTYIRETKSLIVYDTYIWEVVLTDDKSMGINWSRFNYTPSSKFGLSLSGPSPEVPGSIGLGVVYNTGTFALDVLAKFLQSQGTLRTISQPKITMISGGTASFRNGNAINYVSQVGTTTNASSTTTSVTTAQVLSGLDMTVSGDVSDGTVYTNVRITMNDLQRFNNFVAVGTQLQLPQISNREIMTDVRTRSNDTILLAGINSSRSQADDNGLPVPGKALLPTLLEKSIDRSEMVIVLKPRVIRFTNATPKAALPLPAVAAKTQAVAEAAVVSEVKAASALEPIAAATPQKRGLAIEVIQRREASVDVEAK